MTFITSTKKSEYKPVYVYKFVDVQSGDVEYSFWADKYEEEVYFGRKTVQELVVEDFCAEDHI